MRRVRYVFAPHLGPGYTEDTLIQRAAQDASTQGASAMPAVAGSGITSALRVLREDGSEVRHLSGVSDAEVLTIVARGALNLKGGSPSIGSADEFTTASPSPLPPSPRGSNGSPSGRPSTAHKRSVAHESSGSVADDSGSLSAAPRRPRSSRKRDAANAAPPMTSVGSYRVGRLLGEGGFGQVRLATHAGTGAQVALKFLPKGGALSADDAERIINEISCLSDLTHAHVIKLEEVINAPEFVVIALEYAPGGDMHGLLMAQPEARFAEAEARDKFAQIAKAVQFAHSRGVVHRDLKLENVLLGSKAQCLITDFGLSQYARPGETVVVTGGSLFYMPPEVVRGDPSDGVSVDVWCLGVMLFMLLTGQLPFRSATLDAVSARLRREHRDAARYTLARQRAQAELAEAPADGGIRATASQSRARVRIGASNDAVTSPSAAANVAPVSVDTPSSASGHGLPPRRSAGGIVKATSLPSTMDTPSEAAAAPSSRAAMQKTLSPLSRNVFSAVPQTPPSDTLAGSPGNGEVVTRLRLPSVATAASDGSDDGPTAAGVVSPPPGHASARARALSHVDSASSPMLNSPEGASPMRGAGNGRPSLLRRLPSGFSQAPVAAESASDGVKVRRSNSLVTSSSEMEALSSSSSSSGAAPSLDALTRKHMASVKDEELRLSPHDYAREAEDEVDIPRVIREVRASILACDLSIPAFVPPAAASLIRSMLSPRASDRPNMLQVVRHEWIRADAMSTFMEELGLGSAVRPIARRGSADLEAHGLLRPRGESVMGEAVGLATTPATHSDDDSSERSSRAGSDVRSRGSMDMGGRPMTAADAAPPAASGRDRSGTLFSPHTPSMPPASSFARRNTVTTLGVPGAPRMQSMMPSERMARSRAISAVEPDDAGGGTPTEALSARARAWSTAAPVAPHAALTRKPSAAFIFAGAQGMTRTPSSASLVRMETPTSGEVSGNGQEGSSPPSESQSPTRPPPSVRASLAQAANASTASGNDSPVFMSSMLSSPPSARAAIPSLTLAAANGPPLVRVESASSFILSGRTQPGSSSILPTIRAPGAAGGSPAIPILRSMSITSLFASPTGAASPAHAPGDGDSVGPAVASEAEGRIAPARGSVRSTPATRGGVRGMPEPAAPHHHPILRAGSFGSPGELEVMTTASPRVTVAPSERASAAGRGPGGIGSARAVIASSMSVSTTTTTVVASADRWPTSPASSEGSATLFIRQDMADRSLSDLDARQHVAGGLSLQSPLSEGSSSGSPTRTLSPAAAAVADGSDALTMATAALRIETHTHGQGGFTASPRGRGTSNLDADAASPPPESPTAAARRMRSLAAAGATSLVRQNSNGGLPRLPGSQGRSRVESGTDDAMGTLLLSRPLKTAPQPAPEPLAVSGSAAPGAATRVMRSPSFHERGGGVAAVASANADVTGRERGMRQREVRRRLRQKRYRLSRV